jgi:hypothetical protein
MVVITQTWFTHMEMFFHLRITMRSCQHFYYWTYKSHNQATWDITNAKTRANLLLCIKDDQLIHVKSFKTSQKFEDQVIIRFKTTNIVDKIVSQEKSIH